MSAIVVTTLAELEPGDVLVAVDGEKRNRPLTVATPLGPIESGSPIQGVRFDPPTGSIIDWVFYPSQMDGRQMEILRS